MDCSIDSGFLRLAEAGCTILGAIETCEIFVLVGEGFGGLVPLGILKVGSSCSNRKGLDVFGLGETVVWSLGVLEGTGGSVALGGGLILLGWFGSEREVAGSNNGDGIVGFLVSRANLGLTEDGVETCATFTPFFNGVEGS